MTIADLIILTKLHPLEHILDKQFFIFTPHKFDPQQIAIMPRVELSAEVLEYLSHKNLTFMGTHHVLQVQ